jgi:hypothetical protein
MRAVLATLAVVAVVLTGVGSASARPVTYSLAATKACLVKKGVQLQSGYTGNLATLTPAQRSESLIGTLPTGNAPTFLYLAIGRSSADALAPRGVLKTDILPNPTAANSWTGAKANAAWIVVSLGGSPPGPAAHTLLLSCLTEGAPPTGKPPQVASYSRDQVALCMAANGRASVLSGKGIAATSKLLLGRTIPPRLVPHLLLAFTSTSAQAKDGLRLFVLFGKTRAEALALRSQLDVALGRKLLASSVWNDSRKNVAWAAQRISGTTKAGIASGKRTLLSCLP